MTDHSHPDSSGRDLSGDQRQIDAIARRAGAELRRPAPEAFADGVRRARRRQQTVRAGLGVGAAVAVISLGAAMIAWRGNEQTLVPTSVPDTVLDGPVIPDVVPDASTPNDTGNSSDSTVSAAVPDDVPQAIFTYADDVGIEQDVFDPVTLELIDTIPIATEPSEAPEPDAVSASGAIAYGLSTDVEIQFDDCGQSPVDIWVDGAQPSGLPEKINDLAVSADGTVGIVASIDCPVGRPLAADFAPEGSFPITVSVFDPDHPDMPTRTLLELDGGVETVYTNSLELSDDGSFLMLSSADRARAGQEGMFGFTKIIDVATGEIVVDIDVHADTNNLPMGDCGFGYIDIEFVSSTAISFVAICPDDGLAVVMYDLVTGETAESVNPQYAGRTYESLPSAILTVDRSTYANPGSAWYVLCAERETLLPDGSIVLGSPTSHPCWVGRGSAPMREIPTRSAVGWASFQPLP